MERDYLHDYGDDRVPMYDRKKAARCDDSVQVLGEVSESCLLEDSPVYDNELAVENLENENR